MSVYTTLTLYSKCNIISEDNLNKLNELLRNSCGANSYNRSTNNFLDLKVCFNYEHGQIKTILEFVSQFFDKEKVSYIGSIDNESYNSFDEKVYLYKGVPVKLIKGEESYFVGYEKRLYDFDYNSKFYSESNIKKFKDDEEFNEHCVKEFVNSLN